jgi:arabinogalactan endo-1,4-beta-galactosidase
MAEYNAERTRAASIMREIPEGLGLGTFFWEPSQRGVWGDSLFDWDGTRRPARSGHFAEFDAIAAASGL